MYRTFKTCNGKDKKIIRTLIECINVNMMVLI